LKVELGKTLEEAKNVDMLVSEDPLKPGSSGSTQLGEQGEASLDEGKIQVEEVRPPVVEIELVENLARWAGTAAGAESIRKAKLGTPFNIMTAQ
jgi:hypothetical protein